MRAYDKLGYWKPQFQQSLPVMLAVFWIQRVGPGWVEDALGATTPERLAQATGGSWGKEAVGDAMVAMSPGIVQEAWQDFESTMAGKQLLTALDEDQLRLELGAVLGDRVHDSQWWKRHATEVRSACNKFKTVSRVLKE